nr:hypothetical protein [Bradyrhizobium diazoefficiens]
MREEDVFGLVACLRDDRIAIERDDLQIWRQQIEVGCRECRQKSVTNSAGKRHCGLPRTIRRIAFRAA